MTAELRDADLGYLLLTELRSVTDQLDAALVSVLRELDLTAPSANVLWHLAPTSPPPSMSELARRTCSDPSTVTFIIDKLEKRGIVERRPGPGDKRVKVVALSTSGLTHREKLVDAMTSHSPLRRLSAKEQRQLHRLLAKAASLRTRVAPPLENTESRLV
ncbi:MarR family winged helix-turn-helix transcriptional regulator [Nocardia altamirensis]|uniref:MarR family winged helix-turn-helix transcriptional regulator n=1 Tax=Nocardia altamirensis TaxID=472158 RepID=UPI0009FE8AE6|nr:MarR family transcriptional regulator [Nocardia altamirensis]